MLKGTVLLELQFYHSASVPCEGGHSQTSQTKVCLPSGYAVDGAKVACGSGGCC